MKSFESSPSSKWILNNIYDGIKNAVDLIDEIAEKLNIESDDFMSSKEFAEIGGLGEAIFDGWQEFFRFDHLFHEKLQQVYPQISDQKERYNTFANFTGTYSTMARDMGYIYSCHKDYLEGKEVNTSKYMNAAFSVKYTKEVFRDWKKNRNGKKLSEYMMENNIGFRYSDHKSKAVLLHQKCR